MSKNKRVSDLLVAKDVANSLTILKDNGVALGTTDTVKDSAQIYITQIDPVLGRRYSSPITGKNVRSYKGEPYRAAVAKIIAVGYNGTSGSIPVINGGEYALNIVVKTDSEVQLNHIQRFNYVADASATEDEIATAFVTAINSDAYMKYEEVSASLLTNGANRGIAITAVTPTTFDVAVDLSFAGVPVTETQSPDLGNGLPKQMREIEETYKGYKGFLNRIWLPDQPTYFTDPATNYDMIVIEHGNEFDQQNENSSSKAPLTTYIMIPDTIATFDKTNFLAALDSYMGSVGFAPAGI